MPEGETETQVVVVKGRWEGENRIGKYFAGMRMEKDIKMLFHGESYNG